MAADSTKVKVVNNMSSCVSIAMNLDKSNNSTSSNNGGVHKNAVGVSTHVHRASESCGCDANNAGNDDSNETAQCVSKNVGRILDLDVNTEECHNVNKNIITRQVSPDNEINPDNDRNCTTNNLVGRLYNANDDSPLGLSYPGDDCTPVLLWNSVNTKTEKLRVAENLEVFQAWKAQTQGNFGFIALYPLLGECVMYDKGQVECPIKVHKMVKSSGCFNFQKAKLRIRGQLNIQAWQAYLANYRDWQLIKLLAFGFPQDFDEQIVLKSDKLNHKSSLAYPDHILHYLSEEITFKAIMGLYEDPPLPDMHTSPFITREKPDLDKRRVIVDLSWPHNNSVNAGVYSDRYLETDFLLTYSSVDDITARVIDLGKGSHLFKVDISRVFRHIKMDPIDYNKLGLKWDKYFLTLACHLGSGTVVASFRVSDVIRFIMKQKGHSIINYIDDLIGYALPSQAQKAFKDLCDTLTELGLAISVKKLVSPNMVVTCLGVDIDTTKVTVAVPPEKLGKSNNLLKYGPQNKHVQKGSYSLF